MYSNTFITGERYDDFSQNKGYFTGSGSLMVQVPSAISFEENFPDGFCFAAEWHGHLEFFFVLPIYRRLLDAHLELNSVQRGVKRHSHRLLVASSERMEHPSSTIQRHPLPDRPTCPAAPTVATTDDVRELLPAPLSASASVDGMVSRLAKSHLYYRT